MRRRKLPAVVLVAGIVSTGAVGVLAAAAHADEQPQDSNCIFITIPGLTPGDPIAICLP